MSPFHIGMTHTIKGSLNLTALEQSLNSIIERHVCLRSAIVQNGDLSAEEREVRIHNLATSQAVDSGLYSQHIVDCVPLQIEMHFLEPLDSEEQRSEMENISTASISEPFDYSIPPFMRVHLFRLSNDQYRLVLILQHLICDMHSLVILYQELKLFYDSIVSNVVPQLPPIKHNFMDFALEQHQQAKNNKFDKSIQYWRDQLIQFGAAQPILADLPPAFRGHMDPMDPEMGVLELPLDEELLDHWESYGRKQKMSLYTVYIAACMILFRKCKAENAIAIWSNFANRTNPNYLNSIGSFGNSHLLGIELLDTITLSDALMMIRTVVLNAIANQNVPLPLVLNKLDPLPRLRGVQVVCDMIQTNRSGGPKYNSKYVTFTQEPLPAYLLSGWSEGLTISLWHYGSSGRLSATFSKRRIADEGAFNLLNAIKNTISWCVENKDKRIMDYNFKTAGVNTKYPQSAQ